MMVVWKYAMEQHYSIKHTGIDLLTHFDQAAREGRNEKKILNTH
jgi:hypothetical protein